MATSPMNTVAEDALRAAREASAYFEKFDKANLYDAIAHRDSDWLLANQTDTVGGSSKFLDGLQPPDAQNRYVVLVPQRGPKPIKLQELHQVVRELVEGIYVFQQLPSIVFEPNHDSSSSCCISSAYHDTLIGQALFAVNYFVVSLLHGTTIPQKERRGKLSDTWKKSSAESLRSLFIAEGMVEMKDDPELGNDLYQPKKEPFWRLPQKCVDCELAKKELDSPRVSTGEEHLQQTNHISRDFFVSCLHNISMGVVLHLDCVQQDGPFLLYNPGYDVTTSVGSLKEEGRDLFVHLHTYLQKQRDFITEHLSKHTDILHNLELLHLVSFLIPFLITLRQQNKVIALGSIRPSLSKDLLRTDRELPPLFPLKDASRWTPFMTPNTYCSMCSSVHFHKRQGSVTQCQLDIPSLSSTLSAPESTTDMQTCTYMDTTYHCLVLTIEDYYTNTPKLPRWLHAMIAELKAQSSHLPTITDSRILEFLRKSLGPRQVAKMRSANVTLPASIERGLLPSVMALLKRTTKTRLNKLDEKGWSLVHYASAHCRANVLSALLAAGCHGNQCCQTPDHTDTRTLPLHLAAKNGGLDAVCCLLRYGAMPTGEDDRGWLPIHCAAFHNYQVIVGHLVGVAPESIDAVTLDKEGTTPLLLAAMNGGLDTVKTLVRLGACLTARNKADCNIVHLSTAGYHLDILKYLIDLNHPTLPVWESLVPMLASDPSGRFCEAAARVLDALTRWKPVHTFLLARKAIGLLVALLKTTNDKMQHLVVQVLANISHIKEVGVAIVESEGLLPLVNLLKSINDSIQLCVCLVLCDLGITTDNQVAIVKSGAAPSLVQLLKSDCNDVQLFSASCVAILSSDLPENQTAFAECGAIPALMTQLSSTSAAIQASSASALYAILKGHAPNQSKALSSDLMTQLVPLLQSKEVSVHCNAASTIQAAVEDNEECQRNYRGNKTCILSLTRLLRMRDTKVKVCAGCALWAIAGPLLSNRQLVAMEIGIDLLVDMLGIHSEQLCFVCAQALTALASELGENQAKVAAMGGVRMLVEALTTPTSQRVHVAVMRTLAAIVTRPALTPSPALQEAVAVSRGLAKLAAMATAGVSDAVVQVEATCTLAKMVLNNPANEGYLKVNTKFSFMQVFRFFESQDPMVRLMAGYCLAVLVFNNPAQLGHMRARGTLDIAIFNFFLHSDNEFFQAHAAFQVVVLTKLLCGVKPVEIQVYGIKLLVKLCSSHLEHIKVLTAELLATLARCRGGIPDTLVMAGAIDPIIVNLQSASKPVVEGACIALGYLTFNSTALRILTSTFRDHPELYAIFKARIKSIVVSEKFTQTWSNTELSGIPSLSLEVKGGPPVSQGWKMPRSLCRSSSSSGTHSKVPLKRSICKVLSEPAIQSQHTPKPGLLTSRKLALFPELSKTALVQQQSLPVRFS